jgi:hypothetical protein
MRKVPHTHDVSANLELLIARQQKLAAKLARNGKQQKALAARSKLLMLLNQRDLSMSLLVQDNAVVQSPTVRASSMDVTT